MSAFSLHNKIAIVTGGSKGIGRAIALMFADHGADVCIAARSMDALEATRAEIEQRGQRALVVRADIMEDADLERIASDTVEQLGGVDILVNNALYARTGQGKPVIADISRDEYMRMMQGNAWAPLRMAQLCRPVMIERGGGVIINIASNAGLIGDPGLGAYPHAKAALINMTRQLAKEWGGDRIRVVGIAPGLIRTPLTTRKGGLIEYFERTGTPALSIDGTIGEPENIAAMALLLASDAGRYCNAETFVVDGGEFTRGVARR